MDLKQLIDTAREEYKGVKIHLPSRNRESYPDTIRPSSMDGCPLQHAYEKNKREPDFPDYKPNTWLMEHGSYVAPMIQEPLMYYAMRHRDIAFEPEVPVTDLKLGVHGYADGILSMNGIDIIIEIKDTEGKERRSVGEPRLSHCLQALTYCLVEKKTFASIITCSKWNYALYHLLPVDDGKYILTKDDGTTYQIPSYYDNWNTPEILSFGNVRKQIDDLKMWMDEEKKAYHYGLHVIPPIQDPLNHPKGWLCVNHATKPTKTKNGMSFVNCPFAKTCHGLENEFNNTQKDPEKGYVFI